MGVDGNNTVDAAEVPNKVHNVMIVGAGLTGLATALALHRLGIESVVLEQSKNLRIEGAALTLFPNAWRVLNALGVGEVLRPHFLLIKGSRVRSSKTGKVIKEFKNSDYPGGPHEMRQVERKQLLAALYDPIPKGVVRFNSRVAAVREPGGPEGVTEVELEDGTVYCTKVLLGCDGGGSVIAKWAGLTKPQPVGQVVIRGLCKCEEPHNLEPTYQHVIGKGVRMGLVPVTEDKMYWFLVFNECPAEAKGQRRDAPIQIREEALHHTNGWPQDVVDWIQRTPIEGLNRGVIRDRCTWSPPVKNNAITLVGDAWHPMTPNLAQGGCVALEDSIVIARKLHQALKNINKPNKQPTMNGSTAITSLLDSSSEQLQMPRVIAALGEYQRERRNRTFIITLKSRLFGTFLGWESGFVCFIRDKLILPFAFNAAAIFGVASYDCGKLVAESNNN